MEGAVEPPTPARDCGSGWALLIERGWWRKREVCGLVRGELLLTSWRSTAEHTLGWQGGSMKGSACYNSTVELGIPH